MDGNGRWANKKKLSRKHGHKEGIRNCIRLIKNQDKLNFTISELSFYVFSTENWKRPVTEVRDLFSLIETFYKDFEDTAHEKNMIVRHYGSRKKLSKKILKIIDDVTLKTKKNTGQYVNLVFNYGSRDEIIEAYKNIKSNNINYKNFEKKLYTSESYDPDLIIRTGGEMRLSNFMLWQAAYAELYFTKTLWPDFGISNLNNILINYNKRNRRFGEIHVS